MLWLFFFVSHVIQGLYYSYFKTVVNAATFQEALFDIMNDNVTEFPNVINTLQRFNLYPEVCTSCCYCLVTCFGFVSTHANGIHAGRVISGV